mmetsp:Transcript_25713/g.59297  ORF Transcript_25713/g.59297 Transcript_25713/m.59297 type:complete len:205 (-) Transcript_25713:1198-1812(-)
MVNIVRVQQKDGSLSGGVKLTRETLAFAVVPRGAGVDRNDARAGADRHKAVHLLLQFAHTRLGQDKGVTGFAPALRRACRRPLALLALRPRHIKQRLVAPPRRLRPRPNLVPPDRPVRHLPVERRPKLVRGWWPRLVEEVVERLGVEGHLEDVRLVVAEASGATEGADARRAAPLLRTKLGGLALTGGRTPVDPVCWSSVDVLS